MPKKFNSFVLNTVKYEKYTKTARDPFLLIFNFLKKQTAHMEMISVTQCFNYILATLELTMITTGGGHKIITVVQCAIQLILCCLV